MCDVDGLFDFVEAQSNQPHRQWQLRLQLFPFGLKLEIFEIVPAVEDQKDIFFSTPGLDGHVKSENAI